MNRLAGEAFSVRSIKFRIGRGRAAAGRNDAAETVVGC